MIDRLALRNRPSGIPILHQRWSRLLFLHWRLAPQDVRPLVPAALQLDLDEGAAWVGLTVFNVSRMRPTLLPPIPLLSDGEEINLRTYVHRDGVPGLWFFSLDITNALAVWGARLAYRLPYYRARMEAHAQDDRVSFRSERTHPGAPTATFDAAWQLGEPLPEAQPGTLEFFLVERYALWSGAAAQLHARIRHRPWPLRRATASHVRSTLLEAAGLPAPKEAPLLHAQAFPFDVDVWRPTCQRAQR